MTMSKKEQRYVENLEEALGEQEARADAADWLAERRAETIERQREAIESLKERIRGQYETLLEYDRELSVRKRLERAEQDLGIEREKNERLLNEGG